MRDQPSAGDAHDKRSQDRLLRRRGQAAAAGARRAGRIYRRTVRAIGAPQQDPDGRAAALERVEGACRQRAAGHREQGDAFADFPGRLCL
jgi:hypothetical protein